MPGLRRAQPAAPAASRASTQAKKSATVPQRIWGFPKIRGYLFGGPHNKDHSTLGSILGSPCFGKLPFGSGLLGGNSRFSVLRHANLG